MVEAAMKVEFPGLLKEAMASGHIRYRVRPKGDKTKRIRIFCEPGDDDFQRQYLIARSGDQPKPLQKLPKSRSRSQLDGWSPAIWNISKRGWSLELPAARP